MLGQPQTDPATADAIARRIADRRAVLGLGPDALAREAGMSRPYLEFLVSAGPGFDPNGFLRIAAVGRIALPGDPEPAVFPVNYSVDRGTVVYRTHEGGAAAAAPGTAVSFEVDRIDDHRHTGWSVLVTGTAERIEDHETLQRLLRDLAVQPWAGGPRTLWIRIRPTSVSGRRITSTPAGDEDDET
ncbi:pyridoxamine 5'-phosphate oxidase family protein [Kitasatospora phosalacinea]|uniref:pyridoxamine 5'-phosphate oxidase family protein n=1 Tax=Kitasatospora phosalacinea TaxID=2065 RepID=UPI00069173D2|nr:pyridoxamine 5'-phosphate oxidase family protein [Kitasatospora phosalacinea]